MFREATGIVLAEDSATVDNDVKDASATFNQLNSVAGVLFDRGRQTGGLGTVVSLAAVGNRNVHRSGSLQIGVFRNSQFCKDVAVPPASQ